MFLHNYSDGEGLIWQGPLLLDSKSSEAVSLVPSQMKSYENKEKSIWFDGFLMTCYLWKILLVFVGLHMASTHIETGRFFLSSVHMTFLLMTLTL